MRTLSLASLAAVLALVGCSKEGTSKPAPMTSAPIASAPAAQASAATAGGALTILTHPAEVTVGGDPPDFSATAQDGSTVRLSALKGKNVVVYFYPKDETPGCTKEACSFRDAWDALSKSGVVLIGVSADTDASHKAFAEHHKLPFLLVSDPSGELAGAFGVPFNGGFAARQSFVIGTDGKVKKIYRKVDVTVHAQEIAGDVKG